MAAAFQSAMAMASTFSIAWSATPAIGRWLSSSKARIANATSWCIDSMYNMCSILRSMRRGDPLRIREAQRAGFLARLASARNIDRAQALQMLEALEHELAREGLDQESPVWYRALELRAKLD